MSDLRTRGSADATPAPSQEIPREEEALLRRVLDHLASRRAALARPDYDDELVSLRDQIAEARLEDVPALIAQMERVAGISAQRNELRASLVDPNNPYFAHLRLRETHGPGATREREVLIGRTTYIDTDHNVRIVDWRHAPVSRIYYRYAEGDDYEEQFGDREVEGTVLARRTLTIDRGRLVRVATADGTFVRTSDGLFRHVAPRQAGLAGGQGKATRPTEERPSARTLGVSPSAEPALDRHLPEISALLDPRQFDLISRPDAGLVVIQGGAGSGKTTIGLHRIAFLNYQAPKQFAGDRMLVITTSEGLVAYTSEVLPSLGVHKVAVTTFAAWALTQVRSHFPWLTHLECVDDAPSAVSRVKKHPGVLRLLEQRVHHALDNPKLRSDPHGPVVLWAELLTDLGALREAMHATDAPPLPDDDLRAAHRWCSERCPAVAEVRPGETRERMLPAEQRPSSDDGDEDEQEEHEQDGGIRLGIDGLPIDEDRATLDAEDLALLLRSFQVLRGPLRRGREPLQFEHLFVDEAQDFSVAELRVLVDVTSPRRHITLAGDTSQRLVMDNSFRGWQPLLSDLEMQGVHVEPLHIAYRSTREIMQLARDVLGPMKDALPTNAPRTGAPVQMFQSSGAGVAAAQLAEALRSLSLREPRATVGVLARYAEQADAFYDGLVQGEVPRLRRVRAFDFVFRPGVDVTEIRQVKGLEYDYVILVDVNASVFPDDLESRHLLHVGATRAAHQLWIVATDTPSPILPAWLTDAAL